MAELFTILKRKTRESSSSSESGALTPKEKKIYEPSFEATAVVVVVVATLFKEGNT